MTMLVFLGVLIPWLLAVQCGFSVATAGPAGSSFSRIAKWQDADLAAFADVNADRRTDALVLSIDGSSLGALMAPNVKQTDSKPQLKELFPLSTPANLQSIAVADFDGDSLADYLLIRKNNSKYTADVLYGGQSEIVPLGEYVAEPMICDANADLIADIYGENDGRRIVLLGSKSRDFTNNNFTSTHPMSHSSFSAFVSLGSNANPSLVVLVDGGIEVISDPNSEEETSKTSPISLPHDLKVIGKFVFGDFSMSGKIRLLLAGCENTLCHKFSIFTHSLEESETWVEAPVTLIPPGEAGQCNVSYDSIKDFSTSNIIGLSLGDFDLDGYPDLTIGLNCTHGTDSTAIIRPAILRNMAGDKGKVEFQAYFLPGVEMIPNAILKQVVFFDYYEDGVLDLLMSYREGDSVNTYLYAQKPAKEAYFLKVMLTTGNCGSPSQCPNGILPYGLPGYGYRASYETQGADGKRINSSGVFVTSSCCGALQLPFTTFGFGDFATYIENVFVSVPAPKHQTRTHELTFIVPNAQLVVIPYPHDRPSDWQAKLFLQPLYDIKVIYVAITLLVICIILIVVVAILQFLEVRSDRKERMQESQRFHFDAM